MTHLQHGARCNLAACLQSTGALGDAMELYQMVLKEDPGHRIASEAAALVRYRSVCSSLRAGSSLLCRLPHRSSLNNRTQHQWHLSINRLWTFTKRATLRTLQSTTSELYRCGAASQLCLLSSCRPHDAPRFAFGSLAVTDERCGRIVTVRTWGVIRCYG